MRHGEWPGVRGQHEKDKEKTASTPQSDIHDKRRRIAGNGLVDIWASFILDFGESNDIFGGVGSFAEQEYGNAARSIKALQNRD